MNFVKQMPQVQGWYWYVNVEHATPQIGFLGPLCKFYDLTMKEIPELYLDLRIRFGDLIAEPEIGTIEQ